MMSQKYLKRNFTLNALDGITFFLGMIFLSLENVLPVFLAKLGASPFIISLIPALRNVGIFFPSIFVARKVQGQLRNKPWLLKFGLLQRLPWLFSGLYCFFFASDHPSVAIFSIMLAVFLVNLGGGISIPAFTYLTAKTIPVSLRGRLFALRNLISYIFGFAAGFLINRILKNVLFPRNFSILMLIGFSFLMFYLLFFGLMVEPDASSKAPRDQTRKDFLEGLRNKLRENKDLRNYIWGRVFFTLSFASNNFFAVYLVIRYELPISVVATFTLITAGTFLIANPLLGILSDRLGHLFNHFLGSGALILATLFVVFAPSYHLGLISIALGSFAVCVQVVSCFSLPMEFGEDHEIPVYVGLVGFFVGFSSLLIIGFAWVAESYGYPAVFMICFACAVISLVFFARTTEPRGRKAQAIRDIR